MNAKVFFVIALLGGLALFGGAMLEESAREQSPGRLPSERGETSEPSNPLATALKVIGGILLGIGGFFLAVFLACWKFDVTGRHNY